MDLTPKEQAEEHRKIGHTFAKAATACARLNPATAAILLAEAEKHFKKVGELDPPQPEWREGDLVRDRFGGLWQFDGSKWHRRCMERSTARLDRDYGPIHKVHIADPARREVVVSLDGIDLRLLESLQDWSEGSVSTTSAVTIRVAKAAREQLGEVQ